MSYFDSLILNESDQLNLIKLCCFDEQFIKWNLVYRASRDGFASANFHEKCDGISKTLTVNSFSFYLFIFLNIVCIKYLLN